MKIHLMGFYMFALLAASLMLTGCASRGESEEGFRIRVGGYGDAAPVAPRMIDIKTSTTDTTHVMG